MTRLTKVTTSFRKFQKKFEETGLTILLAVQMATVFFVAPMVEFGSEYHWLINSCVLLMAFISVFIVATDDTERSAFRILALGIFGMITVPWIDDYMLSEILRTVAGLCFTFALSWIVGYRIYNGEPVNLHKIRGAATIYLNIALIFAYIDNLLNILVPHSFTDGASDLQNGIGRMIYFSLITLTTTGYGDIVPLHPYARSLAGLEAAVGQFYMAALIGTLIGLHVTHRQKEYEARTKK